MWVAYDPATGAVRDAYTCFHGTILHAPADSAASENGRAWVGVEGGKHGSLARGWPAAFTGGWDAYRDFSRLVDPRALLEAKGMILVTVRANAVLDCYFLPYNFSAKPEWP